MTTKARRVVDKAAKAILKAYDALADLGDLMPDDDFSYARWAKWRSELREYGEYLERCTWPDAAEGRS